MPSSLETYRSMLSSESQQHYTYMRSYQNLLQPGHEPVMTKKYMPRIPRIFNKYLTPEELKIVVLNHPRIQLVIESLVSNTKQSRKELEKRAKDILNEIGLARTLWTIRAAGMSITIVGKHILNGIYINEANINRMRDKLLDNIPVLYLPTHRSYADFVLMSYTYFKYDIEIPGIAAGDNLNSMVGMGTFLRSTGAFYLRRSFTGDELYWELFRKYVHTLMTDYHIGIEFFIEGTRSRENKSLAPKIGLLSMTLEPLFMGQIPDVMIVPISISYDKNLEEEVYVYELLGVPKPKETTWGFFKAFKFMEERFGRWYMDFGEAISAKAFLGNTLNRIQQSGIRPHQQPTLEKDELKVIKELAQEIVRRQQERLVVTTFNLIAYVYAYNVLLRGRLTFEELEEGVLFLKYLFEHFGAHVATDEKNIKADILESLKIHSNILHFTPSGTHLELVRPVVHLEGVDMKRMKGHCLSLHSMQIGVSTIGLQIYINPCLFWVSRSAIVILAGMRLFSEKAGAEFEKTELGARVREVNEIFISEFIIPRSRDEIEFDRNLEMLSRFQIFRVGEKLNFSRNEISDILLSSLVPFLCCYFHVADTIIEKFPSQEFTEKDLYVNVQQRIESGLTARTNYIHPYGLSLDTIKTALFSFVTNMYVEKEKTGTASSKYRCHQSKLIILHDNLLRYLQLLPFTINEYCYVLSKL